MHIVYITKEFPPSRRAGGIGSYVRDIAKGMVEAGNKVTVITASDDTSKGSDSVEDGMRVIRIKGGDFWVKEVEPGNKLKKLRVVYRFFPYRKRIRKVLSELRDADIVEVADFGAESYYLHGLNVPVVIRLHTPSNLDIPTLSTRKLSAWKIHKSLTPLAEIKVLKRAKYVSGCSDAILQWVKANMEMSPRVVRVIKNPANFQNVNIEKIDARSSDTKTIFCAGTISETKGVGDLIDACRILIKQGKNIRLLLAGKEGKYAADLKQTVSKNHEDWCVFLGKLNREDLFAYYQSADVCCFPSWWENMPMVCLEAMSFGAVCIASNSGGAKEIITDGVDGFIAPIKQPQKLAAIIDRALSLNPQEKAKMKDNAKRTIAENFDIKIIVAQMTDFYKDVIDDFASLSRKPR